MQLASKPKLLELSSLAQLYSDFESIFLRGDETKCEIKSSSGHVITVFDRNFFHLVKLQHQSQDKFYMPHEKIRIRSYVNSFGGYTIDKIRARNLRSAYDTLVDPHEVYEITRTKSASHVFLKDYDDKPYPVTVVLVGPSDGVLVPITSFPATRSRANTRWCKGKLVWQRERT